MKKEDEDICLDTFSELLNQKDAEIIKLKKEIEEKNESLHKAGEMGRGVLQQNSHLEEMIEDIQKEHAKVVEEYEQEKYSLQNKLEVSLKTKEQAIQNLQEESQRSKTALEHAEQQANKRLSDETSHLHSKIDEISADLQQEKLMSSQRYETIQLKEKQIQTLQKELKQLQANLNDTLSTEVAELTNENCELKLLLHERETEQHELNQIIQQLRDMHEMAKLNEENLRQAKEDAERETSSYYTALENSREECRELQAELDILCLQPNDPNSRGNSLFAEVEDKRVQAEKRLVSMKAQYKCMQTQNEQLKHYILKLKMQMSALLETRSRTSDKEYVRSLEESLSVARNDNQKLVQKIKTLQEKLNKHRNDEPSQTTDPQSDNTPIIQFFKNELKDRDAEVGRLAEELRLAELYLMAEEKKVSELRQDVYDKNRQLDISKSANFKQQIEIDRLKMKCGEDVRLRSNQRRWKPEKINPPSEAGKSATSEENAADKEENKENENIAQGRPLPEGNLEDSTIDPKGSENARKMPTEKDETKAKEEPRLPLTEKVIEAEPNVTPSEETCLKPAKGDPRDAEKPPEVLENLSEDQQTKSAFVKYNKMKVETVNKEHVTTAADCKQQ